MFKKYDSMVLKEFPRGKQVQVMSVPVTKPRDASMKLYSKHSQGQTQ